MTPEATPHPRKVKFDIGGAPEPGIWYLRDDPNPEDPRVIRLFAEPDITDVMVAGDFVTIGLDRGSSWEDRLEPLVDLVTELFESCADASATRQSRDELIAEGRSVSISATELHLLDPDEPESRARLETALDASDARIRRIAVAVLSQSSDQPVVMRALEHGYADTSRIVRRVAVDSAVDLESPELGGLLSSALLDHDPWIRWKSVRGLRELGLSTAEALAPVMDDPDFQVRMEVEASLRR